MTKLPEDMRNAVTNEQWKIAEEWLRDFHGGDSPDDDWETQSLALLVQRIQVDEAQYWRDYAMDMNEEEADDYIEDLKKQ
jgi:hypothetical protein